MIITGNQTKRFYYINKKAQPEGHHLIHTKDCWVMPNGTIYVGRYATVEEAIKQMRERFPNIVPCSYCHKEV